MAIVLENFNSGTGAGGTSTTITKPSGLAVGDVMVVTLGTETDAANLADQSGWTTVGTLLETGGTGTPGCRVYIKEATSGDVSGGNFSFTHSALSQPKWSIARVSGATITGYQWSEDEDVSATTTPTYTPGVTPGNPNSLLFMIIFSGRDASFSVSGYAVANDSLTWTERYDTFDEFNEGITVALATAPKTGATATGDFSATLSASQQTSGGLLSINDKNASVSPAVVGMSIAVQDPSVTGGSTASPSVVTVTATPQNPTVTIIDPKWVNQDKSDTNPTITNTPKS